VATPPSAKIQATIAFVDLAGFTALTEAQGDEDAAKLATKFAEMTRGALAPGDRLIKTLGDAVLVTSPAPESGIALVDRVFTLAAGENGFPSLRAGLHHGPVIAKDGDVFGATVNLAARVANEAFTGEVLGTEPIATAARAEGIPLIDLGPVSLKNVKAQIPLYSLAIVVGDADDTIDPVCRMPVDRHVAAGRLSYRGVEHWFCSLSCAAAFASNPGWHVGAPNSKRGH
jgi:adenylate cyclase